MAKLSEEIIDGVTVFHLTGSLTQDAVPEMELRFQALSKIKGIRMVIDVAKVDAITTPAITVFLAATREIEAGGGRMIFSNVKGITGDIFAMQARCDLHHGRQFRGGDEDGERMSRQLSD